MFRRTAIGFALAACMSTTLVGCGSSSNSAARLAAVKLTIRDPLSGTRVGTPRVTVTGNVSPWRATVLVAGHQITVDDSGDFRTTVALALGTNLIDVIAGAPQAAASMSAIRVVRYALITVPSVTGHSPAAASKTLTAAGFKVKIDSSSDPLDDLLPLSSQVCSQSPASGRSVTEMSGQLILCASGVRAPTAVDVAM